MAYDKDQIKNELELDDIFSLVEEWGGNPSRHGDMLMIDTICHNLPGEGSHKLYYYDNTKLFKCYTGCSDYFDVFQLLTKVQEVQFDEEWSLPKSVSWIARKFGFQAIEEDEFDNTRLEDWSILRGYDRLQEVLTKEKKCVKLKEYKDSILKNLAYPIIRLWEKEGISRETIKRFGICYYPKDCHIIIPHKDVDGGLVGIRSRTLIKEDADRYGKYRPSRINGVMYNHPLGFVLYGLDLNKNNIRTMKKAIIFEGEKSVMLYDSYFGSDNNISVACCGSSISNFQFELLRELGVEELVIAFDRQFQEVGDKEHKVYTKNIQRMVDKYKNYMTISCLYDKDKVLDYKASPIDHGPQTFLDLFKNRIIF